MTEREEEKGGASLISHTTVHGTAVVSTRRVDTQTRTQTHTDTHPNTQRHAHPNTPKLAGRGEAQMDPSTRSQTIPSASRLLAPRAKAAGWKPHLTLSTRCTTTLETHTADRGLAYHLSFPSPVSLYTLHTHTHTHTTVP